MPKRKKCRCIARERLQASCKKSDTYIIERCNAAATALAAVPLTKMAVTITLLLMRHGLSCSNVLDGCMTHIENVDNAFQPEVFDAIDRELVDTPFDRAVGSVSYTHLTLPTIPLV